MEIKSEQDPKWENLSGDILGVIFGKLEMMDVTMGASRVCTSWFLAAQNSTLWNTINLVVSHENSFFYNPRVDPLDLGMDIRKRDRQNALNIGLYFSPYAPQYRQIKEGQNNLRNLLIEITKLSCTAPRNLFFNLYSYIQDKELVLAAERMPNVEKLVLPMWSSLSENSFRFAFSQWKNLRTLVIIKNPLNTGTLELQAVGENCTNLTNLKFVGLLDEHLADQIVLHLQSLKILSLRCSFLYRRGLSRLLLNGLKNLEILNLSHSIVVDTFPKLHFRKLYEFDHSFETCTTILEDV
ncbi:F-box-like domain superfamily [Arabidopsis suecica]|uniref:F-box-like domain superfamily n=1 Tax=Arabidopsis suecica TaxID=45249 RepID=A0A8T1XY65_ARASU|nr:F-box-like domain superfamily [Arabidopsis suecica]